MGWDKGRYYTRSRKVNGHVVREYIGTGEVARLAARMDAIDRLEREADLAAWKETQAELEALDVPLKKLNHLAELLARAALLTSGYRQHKRGEWRKQREQQTDRSRRSAGLESGA
jgi:crotonobetainyl-CoA:carnitine CoA-transferase CaiB-like acyl-CoA transferase